MIPFVEGSPFIVPDVESVTMYDRLARLGRHVIRSARAIGCLLALCGATMAGSVAQNVDEPAEQHALDLAPPVLLKAGDQPIDVDGHAAAICRRLR